MVLLCLSDCSVSIGVCVMWLDQTSFFLLFYNFGYRNLLKGVSGSLMPLEVTYSILSYRRNDQDNITLSVIVRHRVNKRLTKKFNSPNSILTTLKHIVLLATYPF